MKYNYGVKGIRAVNGVLTIPKEFTDLGFRGIYGISELVEINVLGNMEFVGGIANCPNLRRVNYANNPRTSLMTYHDCYSLEELSFAGEKVPVKVCGAGVFGYVYEVKQEAPYTIYKARSEKNGGTHRTFIGTVINGFEYVGIGFDDGINGAMHSMKLRIKKHLAPQLYYNDGFYGDKYQARLLDGFANHLLENDAVLGSGDKTFNQFLCDGNVPAGNPHGLLNVAIHELKAYESAKKLWKKEVKLRRECGEFLDGLCM